MTLFTCPYCTVKVEDVDYVGHLLVCPKRKADLVLKRKEPHPETPRPTLKELFKGEGLDGYIEATRVKTLDNFFPQGRIIEKKEKE